MSDSGFKFDSSLTELSSLSRIQLVVCTGQTIEKAGICYITNIIYIYNLLI